MPRKPYPSDLKIEEFNALKPFLASKAENGGRSFTYPLKDIIDALLYVKTTGGSWRSLPHDFGVPWPTVYYHFKKFKNDNTFERITLELNKLNREKMLKKRLQVFL